jgi:hypothetical protein
MPLPTLSSVQPVSPILTNMLLAYKQADDRFIASKIFPWVQVEFLSHTYFLLTKKYWFINEIQKRAAGSNFGRNGYGVESATFTCMTYGMEHQIPDETRANSQVPMALESIGSQWLAQKSNLALEIAHAAVAWVTGVWGNTTTPSNLWSDYANSDPVGDVRTGKRTISQATGYTPNTLAVGELVDDRLVNHPDLIDRVKYTAQANVSSMNGAMAALFGVQNYLVGKATYNTVQEAGTASYSSIIGSNALLAYTESGSNMMSATAGKLLFWPGGGGQGQIRPYREEQTKSDIMQLSEAWVNTITATDLGYFFLSCAS